MTERNGMSKIEYIATLYFTRKFTIDIDQHNDCRRLFNFKRYLKREGKVG